MGAIGYLVGVGWGVGGGATFMMGQTRWARPPPLLPHHRQPWLSQRTVLSDYSGYEWAVLIAKY